MENNNFDKETLHFPLKKLWNENESDENKNKKGLLYLIDKLTSTVPNDLSPLLFRLLNMIFFKKIELKE